MSLNTLKALLAFVSTICITVLMALHTIIPEAGMPIITAVVFYSIGNGIATKQGIHAEPIIRPSRKQVEPEGD